MPGPQPSRAGRARAEIAHACESQPAGSSGSPARRGGGERASDFHKASE